MIFCVQPGKASWGLREHSTEDCERSYTCSSGGMEGVNGADTMLSLNSVEEGLRLDTFLTDINAKTNAKVR